MEEDKKLQSLLNNYGLKEISENFDDRLMQKITAINLYNVPSKPLLSKSILHGIIFVFAAATFLLLLTAILFKPGVFIINFSMPVPRKTYMQLFSFFVSFWIVMFLNMWWKKRQPNVQYH